MNAKDHKAYNDSLRYAAQCAYRSTGESFSVYFNGHAMFVLGEDEAKPSKAQLICIAQQWSGNTIQLRFQGAHSEWVYV